MTTSLVARFALFAGVWFSFWYLSTVYYFHQIHDVGATYWSLGGWGFTVVAPLFLFTDAKLKNKEWFLRYAWSYTIGASVVALLLYYPLLVLILRLVSLLS